MANKTVLIADDDSTFLYALTRRCQELGLEVRTASNGRLALMESVGDPPDLIILDTAMSGPNGLEVCEKAGYCRSSSPISVIVLTGRSDEETIRRCKSLGVDYVHKGPEFWEDLKPLICGHLDIEPNATEAPKPETEDGTRSGRAASAPKILVIDDDPQITRAVMIRLGSLGIDVIRATNAKAGYLLARTEQPDVIITDYLMPDVSGERLLINLKNRMDTCDIPVIVLTGQTVDGHEDLALKREMLGRRGAVAYLGKPLDFEALLEELRRYIEIPSDPAGEMSAAVRLA